jgi:hypothetical protein
VTQQQQQQQCKRQQSDILGTVRCSCHRCAGTSPVIGRLPEAAVVRPLLSWLCALLLLPATCCCLSKGTNGPKGHACCPPCQGQAGKGEHAGYQTPVHMCLPSCQYIVS